MRKVARVAKIRSIVLALTLAGWSSEALAVYSTAFDPGPLRAFCAQRSQSDGGAETDFVFAVDDLRAAAEWRATLDRVCQQVDSRDHSPELVQFSQFFMERQESRSPQDWGGNPIQGGRSPARPDRYTPQPEHPERPRALPPLGPVLPGGGGPPCRSGPQGFPSSNPEFCGPRG